MTFAVTFAFVLALVALGCVALVWLIFESRVRELSLSASTSANVLRSWRARLETIEKQAPTELAVRVVELSEAVERLAATHRRFAGRFDQFVKQPNDKQDDELPNRDELRRQHAGRMMPPGVSR